MTQVDSAAAAANPGDGSRVICYCFDVTDGDIRRYMSESEHTVEGLIDATGVGTKCTACLLDVDLLLDQCHDTHMTAPRAAGGAAANWREGRGLRVAKDDRESAFFIEDGTISTTLLCVNHGVLFEDSSNVATYAYTVRLFGEDGHQAARVKGHLGPDGRLELPFASIAGCPARGWFLLALRALTPGLEGSIRPQLMLTGPGFATTVHTQSHWTACTAKSVLVVPRGDGFKTSVSVLNPARETATITLSLRALDGEERQSHTLTIPPLGSRFIGLDENFAPAPADAPLMLRVASDIPVRKHIVNHLADGWSIDHFPNSK